MSERQRLDLVFEPGLSSRDEVTAISGRGVGMDVVRANIEQLGGRIELDNRPGAGLTLAIHVPLTLAILSAVVVGVNDTCFALPRQAIDEIIAMRSPAIRIDRVGAQMVVRVRERLMPLIDLGTLMALRGEPSDDATLVIVDVPGGSFALVVDSVLDTEELVVKPAAPAVMAAGLYAGQTLPDSGLPLLLLDCSGIAATAGIRFERVAASEVAVETASAPIGASALLFRDLDGVRRAVALSAVDRVEQVPAHMIARTGGRLRLTVEDRTVPLVATGDVAAAGMVPVLRLHDDMVEMGYPIAEALEIVTLPVEIAAVPPGGAIAGVAVIDGEPTELVDPLWLLASAVDSDQPTAQPLCLLEGSDAGWMEAFLKPALESAGYRVAATLASGEKADVRLAMIEDASVASGGAPVVRLGRRRGEGVYRYDRAELLAAVAASVSGRGA
jgi:two-component system chemotaxis sensor kinase CheA